MQPNTRIAINTIFIYFRLIIVMFLSLFSTRYILLALGDTDFGIYNLIAGVVGLFSFLATTMATSTQRYISYNMGHGDMDLLKEVFYNSCAMHIFIAFLVVVIVEIGGHWCINHLLSIPAFKVSDAIFVLHCVSLGLIGTILSVPYEAILMAYENILFISFVQIVRAASIFIGAVILTYIQTTQALRIYAILMALIPCTTMFLQWVYVRIKYNEIRFRIHRIKDFSLIRDMGSFAGWVFIGITCGTLRTQGSAILLNIFFGVLVNAANGIALQVNGAVQQFSASITTSIRPQLTKSAGCHDKKRLLTLTYAACKYPFLLMTFFATPLMIAMPYILQIWLKEVPEYSVVFCRLMMLYTMISLISLGFTSAIEANGSIKWLHLTAGVMHLAALPIGYTLFKCGFAPQTIMWCIIGEEIINGGIRMYMAKYYIQANIRYYLRHVVYRSCFVLCSVAFGGYFIWHMLNPRFSHLILYLVIHIVIFITACLTGGLNKQEQHIIKEMVLNGYKNVFQQNKALQEP